MKVLDLFCGAGGLSLGLEQAGFDIALGIDFCKDALTTFQANHHGAKTICGDLSTLSFEDVYIENIDIIVGGPPCQGFSISGKRDPNDPRNKLYTSFVDAVSFFRPKAFIMENVPNLASMNQGKIKDTIISEFSELGYTLKYETILASDYGVPQNRRRFILIGMLNNRSYIFPNKTHVNNKITCAEAICDLPEDSLEDGSLHPSVPLSDYQNLIRQGYGMVHNHQITKHTDQTKAIIAFVPDGGNYKDLPEKYKQTRKVNIAWTRFSSSKPSLTIDTGHRHHFHYKWDRVPTVRESARLQSFPDSFVFFGSKTSQYKQVGNAVPPMLGKALGVELIRQLSRS